MKYLVTGATGLIGNNLVRHLLAAGEAVRVLTRTAPNEALIGLDVELVQGDVRDVDSVEAAVRGTDCVVHAAAHVQVGWTQSELHRQINVEGTRLIAEAALRHNARLVHISTINTLGLGRLDNPADEETGLSGLVACHYVTSKKNAEQVVTLAAARGLDTVIVHPGFCLGPWDWKPSSGRMLLAVNRGTLVAPSGALNVGDVRDVCAGVAAAAKLAPAGRRYILGGHNMTYLDAWQIFARVGGHVGPRFRLGPIARWLGSVGSDVWTRCTGEEAEINSASIGIGSQQTCFTSDRAARELGYKIRPLEDTVADAWDWFCEHGYLRRSGSAARPTALSFHS
ncbi:NAD-dependent epimerase/dehydratase family protein [Anatilimnocola floriformis]|uniref:NAD-dependent epimerase/dehydratase family protein n=1 Tax=Anatilimnocola floriformis TaxID=2948575 RepID=UPI0020C3F505|nr:NAD-dependent epimerase/dehydratase family protein [Anatilimnocola floriformis]